MSLRGKPQTRRKEEFRGTFVANNDVIRVHIYNFCSNAPTITVTAVLYGYVMCALQIGLRYACIP